MEEQKTKTDLIITLIDENGNRVSKPLPKGTAYTKLFDMLNKSYNLK